MHYIYTNITVHRTQESDRSFGKRAVEVETETETGANSIPATNLSTRCPIDIDGPWAYLSFTTEFQVK